MRTTRSIVSFIVAVLASGPAIAADAARLRLPHDLTVPRATSASAAHGTHAFATSPGSVGSSNTTTADAPVPRPNEAPCVDTLFAGAQFAAYASQSFAYAPPTGCPGPYAKIVFNGNFGVTAGVQFDRTASIELGNVPLFFGTTAEPGSSLAPSWHVERDVTDDAALLAGAQTGEADIFNIVDGTYTGVISGTAFLQFYPATRAYPAAPTPQVVAPFPGVAGGPQHLPTPSSTLSETYALPTNVDAAYLDIYAQSQQTDEQYFLCAPNDVASEFFACGNGPFRETEVSIDGTPAGVAPVYPWIFTGGLDPYLWFPIPGVQTLEFKPYRVNLTPFAGSLANGKTHTVTISVDNADTYFQAIGTLYAFEDTGSKRVTGALTRDTLAANPQPAVVEKLSGSPPSVDGTISVSNARTYEIDGYVNTSHGRVSTSVLSSIGFSNLQTYSNESDFTGTTAVRQATTDATTVLTLAPSGIDVRRSFVSYPLSVSLDVVLDGTGTGTQVATIDQGYLAEFGEVGPGVLYGSYESNEVAPSDTLDILDDAFITGNANQKSVQRYVAFDTTGTCFTQTIAAANNVLTSASPGGCGLSAEKQQLRSLLRPVGSSVFKR
jgi:hypothetical protein